MALCTVAQAIAELKATDTTGTPPNTNPAILLNYIGVLTRRIQSMNGGLPFEPYYDTKYYTARSLNVNIYGGILTTFDPLLEPVTIQTDGTALIYGTDVLAYPQNQFPIYALRLVTPWNPVWGWYPTGITRFETVTVTGWYGYRENYLQEGWLPSTDSIQNGAGITDSGTSITVTSVSGTDYYDTTPRFSPGNLLRIENEMCEIRATDAAAKTLTVTRGARGTTAVAHAQGTIIKIWYPQPDLVGAVARSVALRYTRRGAYERIAVQGIGTVAYPNDLLDEVYDVLQGYQNR